MKTAATYLGSDESLRMVRPPISSGEPSGIGSEWVVPSLTPRSVYRNAKTSNLSIQEEAFRALADAKIWTSKVAMHLDPADRKRYFRQLDLLHDCDEWFDEDKPLKLTSYKDFIRLMLSLNKGSKPSLALSHDGSLLAIWQRSADRLTLEFSGDNVVEWVIRRNLDGFVERAAGSTTLDRIQDVLLPFGTEDWFGGS